VSKYTADEVEKAADGLHEQGIRTAVEMLSAFANRLRQEEKENKRDPVTEPRPGDIVLLRIGEWHEYKSKKDVAWWPMLCAMEDATIIRRREVQQ